MQISGRQRTDHECHKKRHDHIKKKKKLPPSVNPAIVDLWLEVSSLPPGFYSEYGETVKAVVILLEPGCVEKKYSLRL